MPTDLEHQLDASIKYAQMKADLEEAKARLKDLAYGAQMMLDMPQVPGKGWPESAMSYVREVLKVSRAPL